jgi:hypothetical protein
MSPLPGNTETTTTSPILRVDYHQTSSPNCSPTYENFVLVLIATYLLWALFYGIYTVLRFGVWLFEHLQAAFLRNVATQLKHKDDGCETGCITEIWFDDGKRAASDEKPPVASSATATSTAPSPSPNTKTRYLRYTLRQRSGTV